MEDKTNIIITAVIVMFVAGAWLYSVSPFRTGGAGVERAETLIKEAESLALDYNKVLSGQDAYIGKYVFWCVQNKAKDEVFYNGDTNFRLAISNYEVMPKFSSGKHAGCNDMLLNIEDVRKTRAGAGVITAEFVYGR